jgi:sugar phosphate isomerase/epimerase
MQLGCGTWGMPKIPIDQACAWIAELGYQGIELSVTPGWSTELYTLGPVEREWIRRLLSKYHLALTAIANHVSLCAGDPEADQRAMQRLRDGIDLAAELTPLNGTAIMMSGVGGVPDAWDMQRQHIVERLGELARYAESHGVLLAVEPHCASALNLPERALWLLEQVASPAVGLNFDISHMDVMGIGIDECVPLLAPYALTTHVKDQRGRYPNHEFLTPGEGPFDFVHYLQAMAAAGYDGDIVVEVSVMVQARPDYDPYAHAALAYRTLAAAFEKSGAKWARH